jgi:hypothetical protein
MPSNRKGTRVNIKDIPVELLDLFDEYIAGNLDEAGTARLNDLLLKDEQARLSFILYFRTHTDLYEVARASKASQAALNTLSKLSSEELSTNTSVAPQPASTTRSETSRSFSRKWLLPLAAASVILAAVVVYRTQSEDASAQIAWIQNAQNCKWNLDLPPTGDLRAGRSLQLESGLVEIGFESGASIVLQGPAALDLLSNKSAHLRYGKLAAKVPKSAHGFTILSPEGKIIDLGTEFVMSVAKDGTTEVFVDKGEVQALGNKGAPSQAVHVKEKEGVRLADGAISMQSAKELTLTKVVRQIVLPPIIAPRGVTLDFTRPIPGTISDAEGFGTGLTHRLPGTGKNLLQHDKNLKLNIEKQQLELLTTNSDINHRFHLNEGEYLGFRLSDYGFTGSEDFSIAITIPSIPALSAVGQFGLFAGTESNKCIRGGLIRSNTLNKAPKSSSPDEAPVESTIYRQFMVNNNGGSDSDGFFVGLYTSGEDMQMTLRRSAGKYYLTVGNSNGTNTLDIRHPEFLDGEKDIFVGLYGANTQSDNPRTLIIKKIEVTVWEHLKSPPLAAK